MICNRRAALSSNFHSVVPALTTTTLLTILNRQRSDPPRSSVTWPTIEQRLLEPLRGTGTPVDIFAFHVVPDPAIVDGVKIDLNVSRLIPAQYYEEMNQSAVDQLIGASHPPAPWSQAVSCIAHTQTRTTQIRTPELTQAHSNSGFAVRRRGDLDRQTESSAQFE
jgi:hypothetical protein